MPLMNPMILSLRPLPRLLLEAGANVVDVKQVLTMRLFFHVAHDLEDPVVLVQQGYKMGKLGLNGLQLDVGLASFATKQITNPSH